MVDCKGDCTSRSLPNQVRTVDIIHSVIDTLKINYVFLINYYNMPTYTLYQHIYTISLSVLHYGLLVPLQNILIDAPSAACQTQAANHLINT